MKYKLTDIPVFWSANHQSKNSPKSATRKIADLPKICRHPEHLPPMYQAWEPGIYEHICPSCGHRTQFTINPPVYTGQTIC